MKFSKAFRTALAIGLLATPAPAVLLGPTGSRVISVSPGLAAVDAQGSVYLVSPDSTSIAKFSSDGQVAWRSPLAFYVNTIAVDPSGGVYLTSDPRALGSSAPAVLARINADGSPSPVLVSLGSVTAAATIIGRDGRVWITGTTTGLGSPLPTTPNAFQTAPPGTTGIDGFVVRLNAQGTSVEYATYLAGSSDDWLSAIAADASGAAVIAGCTYSADFPRTAGPVPAAGCAPFLTSLKPDGSGPVYSVIVAAENASLSAFVAVDPSGNAVVAHEKNDPDLPVWNVARFTAQGVETFSRVEPDVSAIAVDSAGQIYLAGPARGDHRVRNSIAACGSAYLTVLDAAGEVLQSTWIPAGESVRNTVVAVTLSQNSAVYTLTAGSLQMQGASLSALSLTRLIPDDRAQTVKLACVTDAATFDPPISYRRSQINGSITAAGIAPGEILSIFGNGLGPDTGVQPQVTLTGGFPAELAGVQVLFDGRPAPLLYVQESQLNVVAPWSLTPRTSTEVCVVFADAKTNCLVEPVVEVAPAVFRSGGLNAAAVNEDGTINSAANPAPQGSFVSIFATGFGPVRPTPSDGAITEFPLPENALDAEIFWTTISGIGGSSVHQLEVTYAGPAPFQVAGVSQVNFRLPGFTPLLTLAVGGVTDTFRLYVSTSK